MLVIPNDQWRGVIPEFTSKPGARSADAYVKCIEQFGVLTHVRYKRNASGKTACNIYAQDVGTAMNAPCPHWVDTVSRVPLALNASGIPVQKDNRMELNGNGICHWLQTIGVQKYGWKMVTAVEAGNSASKGFMTVLTYIAVGKDGVLGTADDGIGHISVIRPSAFPNLRMAQAGASNFVNNTVAAGFGMNPLVTKHLVYLTYPH